MSSTAKFEWSLGYAASAAILAVAFFDTGASLALGFYVEPVYFWLTVVGYLLVVQRSGRRGALVVAVGVGSTLLIYWTAMNPLSATIAGAGALAVFRRPWSRGRPALPAGKREPAMVPRVTLEVGAAALGLAAAHWFYDGSRLGFSLAVWGFWLIQTALELTLEWRRAADSGSGDAFDRAYARARELLAEIRDHESEPITR